MKRGASDSGKNGDVLIRRKRRGSLTSVDRLLERIDKRQAAIQARRGILSESYLLIREDRER